MLWQAVSPACQGMGKFPFINLALSALGSTPLIVLASMAAFLDFFLEITRVSIQLPPLFVCAPLRFHVVIGR
ncbi:hypothetical protein C2U68_20970 [Methylomonas koyamae]|nr:hypothetical protein C2U68_20970 [Methylomonas koyamae]